MYLQLIKSDPSCKSPASSNKQAIPCDQPSPPILSFEPVTVHSCPPEDARPGFRFPWYARAFSFMIKKIQTSGLFVRKAEA